MSDWPKKGDTLVLGSEYDRLREQLRLCNIDQCNTEAMLAQYERDAARYRWLRDMADGSPPWAETDPAWESPQSLDAAVDALMATDEQHQQ